MVRQVISALVFLTAITSGVWAATIDGKVLPEEYAEAIALQDTPTGFGDNLSELDGAYANYSLEAGLELALTGNLEDNGNTIVIFFDTRPGGAVEEVLPGGYGRLGAFGGQRTDDWGTDIDGGVGVSSPVGGGSILSPDFNPDFSVEFSLHKGIRHLNVTDMTVPNHPDEPNRDVHLGSIEHPTPGTVIWSHYRDEGAGPVKAGEVHHAFDNTNTQGVQDSSAVRLPARWATPVRLSPGWNSISTRNF